VVHVRAASLEHGKAATAGEEVMEMPARERKASGARGNDQTKLVPQAGNPCVSPYLRCSYPSRTIASSTASNGRSLYTSARG